MAELTEIDIEKVLQQKAPRLLHLRPLVSYLKKIIHQDEMNSFLREHVGETDYVFLEHVVRDLLRCDYEVIGAEHIPVTDEPLLFVSTHPLGGLDGMINALLLHGIRQRELKVIVNELLMYVRPLENLFVPVTIGGRQAREQVLCQQQMWESTADVLSFPAGKCARRQDGVITEQPWHKSFVQKAINYQRDVIPIRFEGTNSPFFYNLAIWRTRLGIKTNIEQLYLVDEMFGAKGKKFKIYIGERIPWQTYLDKSRTAQQWADRTRLKTISII